jgi:hypothetical protein
MARLSTIRANQRIWTLVSLSAKMVLLIPSLFGFAVLSTVQAEGETISASTASRTAILGSAYQSEKQSFAGQACVSGEEVSTGPSLATFSFDQSLTETQAADQLGLSVGGRARFGVVEASASARFMENAVSSKYSVSAVWLSDYRTQSKKLSKVDLTAIGKSVRENDDRWAETCGDQYVDEISFGAKLFFSIRVDFSSEEQKKQFEAEFGLSGPLYSASSKLETASRRFSRNSKITVSAWQIGGDVSKITGFFPNSADARTGFVECTLGDLSKCGSTIAGALIYATAVDTGFPSQLQPGATPGPAPVSYTTASYAAAGIYPKNYPYLTQVNAQARSELHALFEKQFSLQILAHRLIRLGASQDKFALMQKVKDKIDANISHILDASKVCYNTPATCRDAVNSLQIASISEEVFVLPPLPTGSIRLMTTGKGIWSRQDSILYMDPHFIPESAKKDWELCRNSAAAKAAGVNCGKNMVVVRNSRHRLTNLGSELRDQGVSIVLYVQGVALSEAALRFENKTLRSIPLGSKNDFAEKAGADFAVVVIASNRKNPGWVDFDRQASRLRIQASEGVMEGDGIFYVAIKDDFGRETRFDIEYQKWWIEVDPGNRTKR